MASINIKKDGQWTGKPVLGFKVGEENLTDELKEKIANGPDVDLSSYATKEELEALTAADVGARPDTWMPTAEDVGATSMELLWENASPTSEFAAQTISIDLASYEMVLIRFNDNYSSDTGKNELSAVACVGKKFRLITVDGFVEYRKGTVNANGITFESAKYASTYGQGASSQTAINTYIIPIAIYGIKGVL